MYTGNRPYDLYTIQTKIIIVKIIQKQGMIMLQNVTILQLTFRFVVMKICSIVNVSGLFMKNLPMGLKLPLSARPELYALLYGWPKR